MRNLLTILNLRQCKFSVNDLIWPLYLSIMETAECYLFYWYVLCIGILLCWSANGVMLWGCHAQFGTQKNCATTTRTNYLPAWISVTSVWCQQKQSVADRQQSLGATLFTALQKMTILFRYHISFYRMLFIPTVGVWTTHSKCLISTQIQVGTVQNQIFGCLILTWTVVKKKKQPLIFNINKWSRNKQWLLCDFNANTGKNGSAVEKVVWFDDSHFKRILIRTVFRCSYFIIHLQTKFGGGIQESPCLSVCSHLVQAITSYSLVWSE